MSDTITPPQTNIHEILQQSHEWRGDHFVENPDAAWDLSTEFPINVGELWAGPRGISRIGPASEGYAGYMLPSSLHRFVENSNFSYLLPPSPNELQGILPKQLVTGAVIPDGNGNEKLTVVDFDNVSRAMILEATWPRAGKGHKPLHYSWEIHALPGETTDSSLLLTRMRIEGLKNPKLLQKTGPAADRLTMSLVRRGIVGESDSRPNRKLQVAGVLAGATALGYVSTRMLRK